jgi:hypothetical protein
MSEINALCVRQPYANAIVTGKKKIEYRSRATKVRGKILIYASGKSQELVTQAIIGEVELYVCRYDYNKGVYKWQLRNPLKYKKPIAYTPKNGVVVWFKYKK